MPIGHRGMNWSTTYFSPVSETFIQNNEGFFNKENYQCLIFQKVDYQKLTK